MNPDAKVWRYMSLSRFIWLLQNRQLWMARADRLEDPWECAVTGAEMSYLAARHPITPIGEEDEGIGGRIDRITKLWRASTFINCWCAREEESHALWRVFCGANEGVAIRSNWQKLNDIAQGLRVIPVDYEGYARVRTPNQDKVSMRKRKMFDYEHEVRIIAYADDVNVNLTAEEAGMRLQFNPGDFINEIVIHPEADQSFHQVVSGIVETYAPDLQDRVAWSSMREQPPMVMIEQ